MTMLQAAIPILCSLLIAGVGAQNYIITAPQTLQPASDYVITVYIFNATDVLVEATLRDEVYNGSTGRYTFITIVSASGTFDGGRPGKLTLPIEPNVQCNRCQVFIRGSRGLQFEQTLYPSVNSHEAIILIQTDKAIYKPGQTVRFRVFAVYPDLQLYNGSFSIEIRDPNNNKIKVLKNVTNPSNVVENNLILSDQPLFGTWNIEVALLDVIETHTQSFEVSLYELPRYEVTVELQPYALVSYDVLTGKVKAKYTFGQPVKGFVELHIGPNQGPDVCGKLPVTTQISFPIDGEASFTIPKEDIERAVSIYNGQEVKITAFVKEDATGIRLNGSSVITWYSNKYQIKFTENTPSVFKPGLPYTAFIQVTTPDGKPPTDNNITVSVYTSVSYTVTVDDQALYNVAQFTGTYGLPGRNVTLPASGLLTVDIDIPKNATSITIKATVQDVQATKTVDKMWSQTNTFIQVTLLDKNIKSGSTIKVRVDGTEELYEVIYEVLSRGTTAASGILNGQGKTSFTFDLIVPPDLAPTSRLLVYYVRNASDIVADGQAFNVKGIFKNDVSIAFNKNESEPNKEVELEVSATPGSNIYVLAVDQSILLLKADNDITAAKVEKEVSEKFDQGEKPTSPEFALSYSATSSPEVFTKTGLFLKTNLPVYPPPPRPVTSYLYRRPGPPGAYAEPSGAHAPLAYSLSDDSYYKVGAASEPLVAVEQVRRFFPEVWLYVNTTLRELGTASIPALVPDTITSWIASAFATHPTAGLGVAPTTATLRVFRPFFVSLNLPPSIIRGEQVALQVVVFNYLSEGVDVTVTLKGSSKFQSVKPSRSGLEVLESGDQVQQIRVESEKQGTVYFPILVTEIGNSDIEITAQSTRAADGIRRQIIVQPEGAPVSFNYPIFANLGEKGNFEDTIDFPLPNSVVNGSDRARIKVTGDLIGCSLNSLTSLLHLPTGCGEQTMVNFAPDVYIAEYLQTTGQLTPALKEEIVGFLNAGYQRQLTYQRYDGGFSAFGNSDESGNTWLTAYVSRVFYDAQKFIYIDPQVLIRAVEWLVQRQNKDGSFNEFGKVLDTTTQGTGTGPALTAFVLLSFIKNTPLASVDCRANEECSRAYQWGNATYNAIRNLEGLVDSNSISDQFSLAIVSYALTLANSSKAEVAFKKLEAYAHREGGLLFWTDNSTVTADQGSEFRTWQPPRIQSRPVNILITSYAILTYAAQGHLKEAFPAVQWLTKERNDRGGFASSQDTSVALQALTAFASKSIRPDTNIDVEVTNGGVTLAKFHIDRENALTLQIQELNSAPPRAKVTASGTGFALIEIAINFNTNKELSTPSFDVSTVLLDDDLDSFNLMICTKWLWNRETGMVVQEISIPSGFTPELDSIGNVAFLKRKERRGNTVNVYFDKISKTSVCYSISMTRTDKIARTQENYVRTWAYYNPRDQATVFWQPRKLRDSTICDVCDGCCP